jgi:colanic acid/amylovoran biosynthesis glycosyltransferase
MRSSDPLKVGYVLKRYPRYSETFVVNEILAHEAAATEIEIFSLCPVIETHFQDLISRVRAPVHAVQHVPPKLTELPCLLADAQRKLPNLADVLAECGSLDGHDLTRAIAIALAVRARGITHLHAHFGTLATTIARLAARLAGIGYSFTAHAKDIYFDYAEPVSLATKIADAGAVITVSDYNRRYLETTFPFGRGRIHRLYNGLDLDRFSFGETGQGDPRVLAVGRLVEKKGFDVLIDALALLRDDGVSFTAEMVGDGPDGPMLMDMIGRRRLADRVRLSGPKPQAAVMTALREATVFAAPCVVGEDGNRDGLPTVLLEAMSVGLPVVATDVTGIPELVRHEETGIIVPQRDARALAEALAFLLANSSPRRTMARAARRLVEAEFDIHLNAAQQRAIFREVAQTDLMAPHMRLAGAA